jgi:murein L,D-transpeptidase YcbB/YkuD
VPVAPHDLQVRIDVTGDCQQYVAGVGVGVAAPMHLRPDVVQRKMMRTRWTRRLRWMLAGFALIATVLAAAGEAPIHAFDGASPSMIAAEIRGHLQTWTTAAHRGSAAEVRALERLYAPGGLEPLWLDGAGRPGAASGQALEMLRRAAAEGLDPADYDPEAIAALSRSLAHAGTPHPAEMAAFDVRMSTSMLRYLAHLHAGRVDPRRLSYPLPSHADDDIPQRLRDALASGTLAQTAASLTPQLSQYGLLRSALSRYRAMDTELSSTAAPHFARVLRPGDTYSELPALQRRLNAEGDLRSMEESAVMSPSYDHATVAAVKRFQQRHGLQADGVIGASTQAALGVSPARRARQIELAMERLRWLPPMKDGPVIAINIPMFRLWAADPSMPRPAPPMDMAVIVGRAVNTRTPVLMKQMNQVIFRPWWNVPRSIVRNEILPTLRRDPHYLERHDMEIVRGPGDDAQPVVASEGNLTLLQQGVLRLRQRPGPRNSLGLVKFVFPNDENVYLHGTPAQQLFERSRRDFSHGCVRVEDPVALAEWVLSSRPGWDRARIVAAMQGPSTVQTTLPRPVRVVLFYVTATVMPRGGALHFAEDIYGHDRALETELAHRGVPR